jgi:sulfoxide reductase heme-binding subunit YedZ
VNLTWLATRASGFVAYGLLTASVIWGLLNASRLLGRSVSVRKLTFFHESLSVAALLATAMHLGFLYADSYVGFGVKDLLVPGAASWKPQAVAFGVVTLWGMALVTVSFYLHLRRLISKRVWRILHFGTFGLFIGAMLHGITAGTDSGSPVAIALYASTGAVVAALVTARIVLATRPRGRQTVLPETGRRARVGVAASQGF